MPVTGTFGALNYSRVSLGNPNLQYWGFQFFSSNVRPFFSNQPYIANDYSIISGINFTSNTAGNVLFCKIDGLSNPTISYNKTNNIQIVLPFFGVGNDVGAIYFNSCVFDPTYDNFAILGTNATANYSNNNQFGYQIIARSNGDTTSTGTILANSGVHMYNYTNAPNSIPFAHITTYIPNSSANYQNYVVEFNQQEPNPVAFRSINLSNSNATQSSIKNDFVFMDDPANTAGKANLVCAFMPRYQANGNTTNANMLVLTRHNYDDMTVVALNKAYSINLSLEIGIIQFNTENVYSSTSPYYLMTPNTLAKFDSNLNISWIKASDSNRTLNGFCFDNGNVIVTAITTANGVPRGEIIKLYGANGNRIWSTQLGASNPITSNTSNTVANKLMGVIGSDGNMYVSFCTTFSNVSNSNVYNNYYLKLYSNGNTFSGNTNEIYTFPNNYKIQYAKTNVSLGIKSTYSNTSYTLPNVSSYIVVNRANNFPESTYIVNTNKTNLNP